MIDLFLKMYLIQPFIVIILKINAKEIFNNTLESIDLDVSDQVPMDVYRIVTREGFEINDILSPNRLMYKIGRVFDNKKLVYGDSDLLIYRRVETRFSILEQAKVIMIFSVYRTKNGDIRELLEFIKKVNEPEYHELIRKPLELNLKMGSVVDGNIIMSLDNGSSSLNFDIGLTFRDKYKIGVVRLGDIIVDPLVHKVIYKGVSTYRDSYGNHYVEINSGTNEGEYIFTKYIIRPEKEGEQRGCEILERNINLFV